MKRKRLPAVAVVAAFAVPLLTHAADDPWQTADDYLAWFARNQVAEPQFIDGDVVTYEKGDVIRPFVPPEYQSEMIFEGMEVAIRDGGDLSPATVYQEATERYRGQPVLASDGALENYVAGRPFDPADFTPSSKEDGYKFAWNFNYRWQHEGLEIGELHWVWIRRGGSHNDHEVMNDTYTKFYGGGGAFERILTGTYQRVYFAHRADLPDQDYRVAGKWGEDTEFREYTGFDSPFDIAGTAFLILRYLDPRKTDDSWAYIPSLRRVRRISVEVKSDSLLGTDHTLEDFYCFAGRPLEWDWEYVGAARTLAVARSRHPEGVYYGPDGWTPLDDWALRLVDVVRATPKRANHPYSTKFLHVDRQSGDCFYANAYDRAGKLWKLWQLNKAFTDDPQFGKDARPFLREPTPSGARVSSFQTISVIDKQNNRGTINPCRGATYPDYDIKEVQRSLDVNYLTEGR